jgi:hypothetical protein
MSPSTLRLKDIRADVSVREHCAFRDARCSSDVLQESEIIGTQVRRLVGGIIER